RACAAEAHARGQVLYQGSFQAGHHGQRYAAPPQPGGSGGQSPGRRPMDGSAGQGSHRPRGGDLPGLREDGRSVTALYFARWAFLVALLVLVATIAVLAAREKR